MAEHCINAEAIAAETAGHDPVSAEEAISLVGWGRPEAIHEAAPNETELRRQINNKWGDILKYESIELRGGERRHSLVLAMRRTIVREWWWRWRKRNKLPTANVRPHVLRPATTEGRKRVREFANRFRRPVSDLASELRADLRPLYAARGRQIETADQAVRKICRAIAASEFPAFGQLGRYPEQKIIRGQPETIPPEYFKNRWHTIVLLPVPWEPSSVTGWATCDQHAPGEQLKADRSEWCELQFDRAQFFAWLTRSRHPLIILNALLPAPAIGTSECPKPQGAPSAWPTEDEFRTCMTDPLPLLRRWATAKYGNSNPPGRDQMLKDFRDVYGRVPNISEPQMRALRAEIATPKAKAGGVPAHRAR